MLENEDSVVTSLNELRKLKHERIARQTQSRAMVGAGRAAALAVDPMSEQVTPPPAALPSPSAPHLASVSHAAQVPNFNAGFGAGNAFAGPGSANFAAPIPPPVIQTKTSYGAAVVVAVLLIGGAGAGYMKLQQDTQAKLATMEASVKRAEEDRLMAAGVAAKAEAAARNNLRQCEEKLKGALAVAPVAPAVAPPTEPVVVEKKHERPAPRASARSSRGRSSARASRRARGDQDEGSSKSKNVPMIAKKKKLDNDPLAGLGKL